tara:strand:+ start:3181 stop:4131 length:951 start_codon:yes stop_codon:yes gene_type:complete
MDYYKVLGVNPNSSQEEIKKSFRKLSLKHHPDRGGDAEEFKKINEAYSTLGDNEKKRMYDMQKNNPFMAGGQPGMDGMDNIFKMFFGGGIPGMPPGMNVNGMPGNIHINSSGGFGGIPGMPNVQIFRNGRPVNMAHRMSKPPPIIKKIEISLQDAYNGINYPIEIDRWIMVGNEKKNEKEKIYVNIHKGIDNGEIKIVRDKGHVINDTLKGDVKVFINIKTQSGELKRQGLNLLCEKTISLKEALCGFLFEIKHLNGKVYNIKHDKGNIIPPNFVKQINGLGMERNNMKGNLIIKFFISFPKTLTMEQIEKLDVLL